MLESFTAGALRALDRAQVRALLRGSALVEPADLLAALADESESRAAVLLAEHGLDPESLLRVLGAGEASDSAPPEPAMPQSPTLRAILGDASVQARAFDRGQAVGTEHLLASVLQTSQELASLLSGAGLMVSRLLDRLTERARADSSTLPMPADMPPIELTSTSDEVDLGRILDASANRAREGLRVVEDYVRFVLDDPMLTRRLKDVRHRLDAAIRGLDSELLLGSRDTRGDVGTHIMAADESLRENPRAVLSANFKRTGEALRTLEEYTKLLDVWLAGRFEILRYDFYTLEKLTMLAVAAHRSLDDARLYFLVGGLPTFGDLTWVVTEALRGGVQVVQLREKKLPDRELLARAREIRAMTVAAGARFILNDRPDLARLVAADGVHLGQDDLPVKEARRVAGPQALMGVSTHDASQLETAILEGASYLGVGPVFPSETKDFDALAGLDFVRHAAESTTLPWFAIGGIDLDNLDDVLAAGARRIAVSRAITAAERPRAAAEALRARLDEAAALDGSAG